MAIEEALDGARVWEIVVNSAQRVLHALEPWVDGDPRAVDAMVHLRVVLLQCRDALVDLLVAFPQRLHLLEGRGDDPAHVAQSLPVLREFDCEGEVGVTEDRAVGKRVDQLQAIEPAHGRGAGVVGDGGGRAHLVWLVLGGLGDDLVERSAAVVLSEHVAEFLVFQQTELLLLFQVQLVPELEGPHAVQGRPTHHLALLEVAHVPREEL
mmetsp:Transcript_114449/g.318644  ORF Transcript_114449/g.318644 Transcript_114449/m.318644 type:complete len:209 (-) Transcript_114449:726-1352(-)